jgi:hypothetical protein
VIKVFWQIQVVENYFLAKRHGGDIRGDLTYSYLNNNNAWNWGCLRTNGRRESLPLTLARFTRLHDMPDLPTLVFSGCASCLVGVLGSSHRSAGAHRDSTRAKRKSEPVTLCACAKVGTTIHPQQRSNEADPLAPTEQVLIPTLSAEI